MYPLRVARSTERKTEDERAQPAILEVVGTRLEQT